MMGHGTAGTTDIWDGEKGASERKIIFENQEEDAALKEAPEESEKKKNDATMEWEVVALEEALEETTTESEKQVKDVPELSDAEKLHSEREIEQLSQVLAQKQSHIMKTDPTFQPPEKHQLLLDTVGTPEGFHPVSKVVKPNAEPKNAIDLKQHSNGKNHVIVGRVCKENDEILLQGGLSLNHRSVSNVQGAFFRSGTNYIWHNLSKDKETIAIVPGKGWVVIKPGSRHVLCDGTFLYVGDFIIEIRFGRAAAYEGPTNFHF